MYIGIAYDESIRVRDSDVKYITNSFPLVDSKITRKGCIDILAKQGISEVPKSGCYFCPFTNKSEWKNLFTQHPALFQNARKLEEKGRKYPEFRLTDIPLCTLENEFLNQPFVDDWDEHEITCNAASGCFF